MGLLIVIFLADVTGFAEKYMYDKEFDNEGNARKSEKQSEVKQHLNPGVEINAIN